MDGRGSARGILGGVTCVACVCAVIALAGCGSTGQGDSAMMRAAGTHRSVGTAYVNPEVVACMQTHGVTVLGNGSLRVSKAMTAGKRKAVENRCGFGATKVARPSRKSVGTTVPQPPAKPYQSFYSRRIAKIVACLHRAGVTIPSSDSALLSSTSGIKTRSPRVKADVGKCRSESLPTSSR
jgi:hypothetical protein